MLSIHYVSIMMRIFYIDWQQHWECHRTVNIGDQQNSHKWQTSVDSLGFQWVTSERYWASFQVTKLFHKATVSHCDLILLLHVFVVWNFTRLITRLKSFFFFSTLIWWGSTQLQSFYYLRRILISRPPRVFRRSKRRSCYWMLFNLGPPCPATGLTSDKADEPVRNM